MASQETNRPIDGAIRQSLRAADSRTAAADACPSPDIFAAYYEHSLDPEETARYDNHFATCKSCREILAGVARAGAVEVREPEYAIAASAAVNAPTRSPWFRNPIWLGAAATAVLAVFVIYVFERPKSPAAPNSELAQVQSPPSPVAAQPPSTTASTEAPNATDKSPDLKPPPTLEVVPQTSPAPLEQKKRDALRPSPLNPRAPVPVPRVMAPAVVGSAGAAPATPTRSEAEAADKSTFATSANTQTVEVQSAAPIISADNASPAPAPSVTAESNAAQLSKPTQSTTQSARNSSHFAAGTLSATKRPAVAAAKARAESDVVIKSPDATVTWTVIPGGRVDYSGNTDTSSVDDFLPTTNIIAAGSAASAKVCWLVGASGTILRTIDGRLWTVIPSPVIADLTAVTAHDATSATITVRDGRKFTTSDAGKTWKVLQ